MRFLLYLFSAAIALGCAARAQQTTQTVNFSVEVLRPDGSPVEGAEVLVVETSETAFTDEAGFVEFSGPNYQVGYWTPMGGSLRDEDVTFTVFVPNREPFTFRRASNQYLGGFDVECCLAPSTIVYRLVLRPNAQEFGSFGAAALGATGFYWELEASRVLPCTGYPAGEDGPINPPLASVAYPDNCSGNATGSGSIDMTVSDTISFDFELSGETGRLMNILGLKLEGEFGGERIYKRQTRLRSTLVGIEQPGMRGEIHLRKRILELEFHKMKRWLNGNVTATGETKTEHIVTGYCHDMSDLTPCTPTGS